MYFVATFLGIAFMAILTMMAVQLNWWRRGYHVISRGQLAARLIYTGVILSVIVMMFVGRFLLQWESARTEIIYWLGLVLIVILVAVVVTGDLRNILKIREEKQLQMYRELVEAMRRGVLREKGHQQASNDRTH